MGLKNTLTNNMKQAMRDKDSLTLSVVRMILSDIQYASVGDSKQLSDEQIMNIIISSGKKRKDSIAQFKSAGRDDLVQKEQDELKIIESYLPEQISSDDIAEIIKKIAETLGIEAGSKDNSHIGKLMKPVMNEAKGAADGSIVNALVKEFIHG